MKKTLCKLTAIVVLMAMVLALAACGASSETDKQNANSGSEIELKLLSAWVGQDAKAKVFSQMLDSFNKEYAGKIKVVVEEMTDYNAYNDKIRTLISTGQAPDLFTLSSTTVAREYSGTDKLLDLAPYLDDEWRNDFQAGIVDNLKTEDGRITVLPYESNTFAIMYNKALLASVGYDEFPETWDELFECAEKLKAAGITPFSLMTGENAFTSQVWYGVLAVAIGGTDVYARGLRDPAFVKAIEVLDKMFDYTTADAIGATAGVSAGHFLNGRTAIFINGTWFYGRVAGEAAPDVADNIALAYPPSFEGGAEGRGLLNAASYLCAKNTDDPARAEACVTFLKYITDPERVSVLSADSGALFAIKTELADDAMPLQKAAVELANNASFIAPVYYEETTHAQLTEWPQALTAVIYGEMTPEEFVEVIASTN